MALHLAFATCLLVTLAFTVGFGTRWVKWLLLPALFTVDSRLPRCYTGGEIVLHWQALYAALLPVGQVLSLDAWQTSGHHATGPNTKPTAISSLFYPLLLLQLAVIYFFNWLTKSGASWHDGSAIAKALAGPGIATNFGAMLAQHVPPALLRGMTHATLVVEGALPFLLLSPWARKWTHGLAGALMLVLHGGIHLTLEIGSFSFAMLSHLPLLWHSNGELERVLAPTQRRRRLELVAVASLLYVGTGRISRDLILWPERPHVPMPALLDRSTRALGLWQPWGMFAPEPAPSDYVVVTDAVTRSGLHFDPWQEQATGSAEPLKALPPAVSRHHTLAAYELFLSRGADTKLQSFFRSWVLRQLGPDQAPVERFDAWFLTISTDPTFFVKANEIDRRIGVIPLPYVDAVAIRSFEAVSVWTPEQAFDRKITPEGTNVLNPIAAFMSDDCPQITLDMGEPHRLESAFVQADAGDVLLIEGSLDNQTFRPLAQTQTTPKRQHRSRVVSLPGELSRYIRLRPVEPRKIPHFLSE
ncbi:MAG TPA: HTTM domain-containing protein, partial [Polyangiaceae bacterium]|nr:HTTM domain-containing protein [Polyangiaceae bacterium]